MTGEHDHEDLPNGGRAFAIAVGLNAGYVLIEAGFGFATGSLVLLADAAHNLTDVSGLLVAWGAARLARRRPTLRHTYGLGRATVLAAMINGIAILFGAGAIAWEAVERFGDPVSLPGRTVLWVALGGVLINGATALLFLRGRHRDLNIRGAFLHMAGDAAVSAGVVVAALVIIATGWTIVDPIVAIVISVVVAWSTFGLLKSALHLSLDGVPESVNVSEVEAWLCSLPGVRGVHDLHVWPLSSSSVALTAHLVMPDGAPGDDFLDRAAGDLERRFGIAHPTLQVERGDGGTCRLDPADRRQSAPA
jgi:cobalt-zinc-cadmium efflux system protein